jgi:hypothetical protein
VEQHAEDFEGFLVTEEKAQNLDAPEGERQRTVKEWCTFMGQPTEYGDNILLQRISDVLEKPLQVFSYDSKDDTVYMQTMTCCILSKEETMEASMVRRRPQVSDFQDDDTLRLAYHQHQFHETVHYNCIISNKVCTRRRMPAFGQHSKHRNRLVQPTVEKAVRAHDKLVLRKTMMEWIKDVVA